MKPLRAHDYPAPIRPEFKELRRIFIAFALVTTLLFAVCVAMIIWPTVSHGGRQVTCKCACL